MGLMAKRLRRFFDEHLLPGEVVEFACRVQFEGGKRKALGTQLAAATDSAQRQGVASTVPTVGLNYLGFTDRRLVFVKGPSMKRGELITAINYDEVLSMEPTRAKVMFGKLNLGFRDGSSIVLDIDSGETKPMMAYLERRGDAPRGR